MAAAVELENSADGIRLGPEPSRGPSLTIATSGEPGCSCAPNSRPASSLIPSARNRPRLTTCSTADRTAATSRRRPHARARAPRRTPGAKGTLVMKPTARTDGSVRAIRAMFRWNPSIPRGSRYFILGALTRAVMTSAESRAAPAAAAPGLQQCRHHHQHRPKTPFVQPQDRVRHWREPETPSRSASAPRADSRVRRGAGAMPKKTPRAVVMNRPKTRTGPSRRISSTRGTVAGTSVRKACIDDRPPSSPQAPLTSG